MHELPRGELCRVNLLDSDSSRVDVLAQIHVKAFSAIEQSLNVFVEGKNCGVVAALGGRQNVTSGNGRFPAACRPHQQSAGSCINAAAKQFVKFLQSAWHNLGSDDLIVLRGDETRKDDHPTLLDAVIVEAFTKLGAAKLSYFQSSALGTEIPLQGLQHDY